MEFGDIESDMKVGFGFAIEGMEDIGKIDLKKLNASDVMKFHFPNIAVAYTFYNWYARMNGFSARRSKVMRNKNNEIIQQIFVCYRQGFREKKLENNKIRKREARADTRCGCDAKCSVHIDSDSQRWYVWDFNNDHNHSLVDDDFIGFLPGHRGMDDDDILQMKNLRKSDIRTSQAYGTFANHYGGYKNVTFLIQDMYNEVDKDKRSKGSDSRAALAFLRSLKIDDPTMFLRKTVDEEGRLEHLFWSDGRSQLDYSLFGDVLAFDATYKKNKYLSPLVVFSGVNHHNQTVVFATAIVANEVEDTYVWLLDQFVEVMKGKMPKSVITDGDLAMRKAIGRIFPDAHHRLCVWHLIRNATSNVKNTRKNVLEVQPHFDALAKLSGRGVSVTGIAPPESGFDFYSRFFSPKFGINEDPVCGTAHCGLAPYWSEKLGKCDLKAYMASTRGGALNIHVDKQKQRVFLHGKAVTVIEGYVMV